MSLVSLTGCAQLFFYPAAEHVRTPDQLDVSYEDVWLEARDDVTLHGWLLPARARRCGTVLFLHGNAQNISTHIRSVFWLPDRGFDVLLIDYRGYGASTGSPSFGGLQADIDAAMRYLVGRPDSAARPIAVFGQSLGGSAALYYVAHSTYRAQIAALVAEAPFAAPRDIAREKLASFWLTWPFQWIPTLTLSDKYQALTAMEQISPVPLLLIHGDRDAVIPISHSERLYAAALEPKEFWKIHNAGHTAAFLSPQVRDRFVSFLQAHLCPDPAAPSTHAALGAGIKEFNLE